MHDNRMLHRDIKADNVFLKKGGMVKFGDFGFSKEFESDNLKTVAKAGAPLYNAPEQFMDVSYGFGADVWSLGILLYRLMTLDYPFVPEGES